VFQLSHLFDRLAVMRKRSKKRIPQDQLPWTRVMTRDEEGLHIFGRKSSRWVSGSNRDRQTHIYSELRDADSMRIILKSQQIALSTNYPKPQFAEVDDTPLMLFQPPALQGGGGMSKPKNFCLILGRGRTYNRKLFISRQACRKLVKTGLISGLQK